MGQPPPQLLAVRLCAKPAHSANTLERGHRGGSLQQQFQFPPAPPPPDRNQPFIPIHTQEQEQAATDLGEVVPQVGAQGVRHVSQLHAVLGKHAGAVLVRPGRRAVRKGEAVLMEREETGAGASGDLWLVGWLG